MTTWGCGFDFRVQPPDGQPFLAVEVKGLAGLSGDVMMTGKEHQVAGYLKDRFFLGVVSDFEHSPTLTLYRDPLSQGPSFHRRERIQVTWHATIPAP